MERNYCLYWYKRKEHNNPFKEGYIGITNNIARRNLEHLRNKKFSHFTNALKLYNDINYEILHKELTIEEASNLEYAYREISNTGWNSAIGGKCTLSTLKKPIEMYHQSNPNKIYKFDSITEAALSLDISQDRISAAKARGKQIYGYDGWAIILDINFDRMNTKSFNQIISENLSGKKKNCISIFKGKKRWSDEDKKRISEQHKGKIISEKQKLIVSEKNKLNHTSCKKITLINISNPEKEYTFHSISEASRQLNLPLSRLKSKAQRQINKFGKDGWAIKYLGSE